MTWVAYMQMACTSPAKQVIMEAPSLEWQSASIADVSGEVRVASHNAVPEKPTGFTLGHPGVREG